MSIARRVLIGLSAAAAIGLLIFGIMVYRSVTIERIEPADVHARFAAARALLPPGPSLVTLDDAGQVTRRATPQVAARPAARRLYVLAYHTETRRLLSTDLPFWFLKMKGPVVQYALRDTGFDLDRLGVTAAELSEFGPATVIDWTPPGGNRLLVWTR